MTQQEIKLLNLVRQFVANVRNAAPVGELRSQGVTAAQILDAIVEGNHPTNTNGEPLRDVWLRQGFDKLVMNMETGEVLHV